MVRRKKYQTLHRRIGDVCCNDKGKVSSAIAILFLSSQERNTIFCSINVRCSKLFTLRRQSSVCLRLRRFIWIAIIGHYDVDITVHVKDAKKAFLWKKLIQVQYASKVSMVKRKKKRSATNLNGKICNMVIDSRKRGGSIHQANWHSKNAYVVIRVVQNHAIDLIHILSALMKKCLQRSSDCKILIGCSTSWHA